MAIRDMWGKWVYSVAEPIEVQNRPHTAEEVQGVVEAAAFMGTSRGLGAGLCTGLVVGVSVPLLLWFLLYHPISALKPITDENELRQLRIENERLRSQVAGEKPEEEAKPVVTETPKQEEKAAVEKPQEEKRAVAAENPKKETKAVVAGPPTTRKREVPKEILQPAEMSNPYACGDGRTAANPAACRAAAESTNDIFTCGDGRTVTNPAACTASEEPPSTYICGDGRTVPNPAACRAKGG